MTLNEDLIIERRLASLGRLERRGVRSAKVLAVKIKAGILSEFRGGQLFDIDRAVMGLTETLRDTMLVAFLKGARQSQIEHKILKLGVFESTITHLTALLGMDRRALERQFESQAITILQGVSSDVETALRGTLNDLISSGAHVKEGVQVLSAKFKTLGLAGTSDYRLASIFRTQTSMASNAGHFIADQDPAIQEILWGYKYVTVGDDRVRPEHAALDGTTLPKDDPFWQLYWPPNGWQCRCQVISIFETREMKLPGQLDGAVPLPDSDFRFNPASLVTAA